MPELPEVETVIRSLNSSHIIGKTIQKVEILNSKHLKEVDSINFCSLLENSSFQKIKRKGKWIFIFLSKE